MSAKTLEEEPYVWPKGYRDQDTAPDEDGTIDHVGHEFALWYPDNDAITLDGKYTVRTLEAITAHMRKHGA